MDSSKIGDFIKKIRKDNKLTQKDLADKYNVTYQAVSKWERGINLPDIYLLKKMSEDFNIDIESLLDGNIKSKKNNNRYIYVFIIVLFIISILAIYLLLNKNNSFDFKTITTTCTEFKVSGSIAYDKNKSSIYISHIDYCGKDDNTVYKELECTLYENNNDTITKIRSCDIKNNINLEDYLKDIIFKVDNYKQVCSKYSDNSLYLEINAKDNNDKVITYKVPLSLNSNC